MPNNSRRKGSRGLWTFLWVLASLPQWPHSQQFLNGVNSRRDAFAGHKCKPDRPPPNEMKTKVELGQLEGICQLSRATSSGTAKAPSSHSVECCTINSSVALIRTDVWILLKICCCSYVLRWLWCSSWKKFSTQFSFFRRRLQNWQNIVSDHIVSVRSPRYSRCTTRLLNFSCTEKHFVVSGRYDNLCNITTTGPLKYYPFVRREAIKIN